MNRIFCTFVLFFALSVTVYATDATLNTRNLRVADIAKITVMTLSGLSNCQSKKKPMLLSGLTITIIMIFIAPGSILSLGLIFTLRMLR